MSRDLCHLGQKNLIWSGTVIPICNTAFSIDDYGRTETQYSKLPEQLTFSIDLCPGHVVRIFAFPVLLPIIKGDEGRSVHRHYSEGQLSKLLLNPT